jgi:uncharacterized protein
MGPAVIAFVSSIFVLAGFVKGVVGVGLPTIAMDLLATAMTPAQAAALLTVPSFITNVWQAVGPQSIPLLKPVVADARRHLRGNLGDARMGRCRAAHGR